jgi:hypothetical protein
MKKIMFLIALIISSFFIVACSNKQDKQLLSDHVNSQENTLEPTKQITTVPNTGIGMYKKYISEVDESLGNYHNKNYQDVRYGSFSGYYFYSNLTSIDAQKGGSSENPSDYYPDGVIISYFKDDKLKGFHLEIGWNTSGSYQKGGDYKYQCEKLLIGNDMIYYSYATDSDDLNEIPTFMCIDGISRVRYDKEAQDYTAKYALKNTTNMKEFLSISGDLYEIDRKKQTLNEVSDKITEEYIKWCEYQQRDILTAQKSFQITPAKVKELIPKGFRFSKSYNDYSVADINSDGIDDILVKILPVQNNYAYKGDYSEDSPYRKNDEYGYYQLWVLKGTDDGSYKAQKLMNSIVWDETYTLSDILASEGGFTLNYFVGRSPFETVLRKFQYNQEKQDWLLAAQYKNSSSLTWMQQGLTISGPRDLGENYISNSGDKKSYNVSAKKYVNDNYNSDYDDYGYLIQFADKETSDKVTELVKQELDQVFRAIKKSNEYHDILLQNDPVVFLNENILVLSFTIMANTEDGTSVSRVIPICIDRNNYSPINFKEYLSTDEFAMLCKDSNINISQLENLYQNYDNYEYLLKAKSPSIALCLTEEGLIVIETGENWPKSYTITRDKLVNTKLSSIWNDWP